MGGACVLNPAASPTAAPTCIPHYSFLFCGCPRCPGCPSGGACVAGCGLQNRGVLNLTSCKDVCNSEPDCTAIEVNGCTSDSTCPGKCFTVHGDTAEITNGRCRTDGDQWTFKKVCTSTTAPTPTSGCGPPTVPPTSAPTPVSGSPTTGPTPAPVSPTVTPTLATGSPTAAPTRAAVSPAGSPTTVPTAASEQPTTASPVAPGSPTIVPAAVSSSPSSSPAVSASPTARSAVPPTAPAPAPTAPPAAAFSSQPIMMGAAAAGLGRFPPGNAYRNPMGCS
eukprot:gene13497-biopygen14425